MSSSQPPSNNPNNNNPTYPNTFSDYETDDSLNLQRSSQQQNSGQVFDDRGQSFDNGLFQQMYPFQEDVDEDLPEEIITELDARDRIRANANNNDDDDDAVFSDVVQDAFKKYQNEYSKYWPQDNTTWDNKFFEEDLIDDEQEELYAQMEECWSYMTQESKPAETPKHPIEQPEKSKLNPDANEFKPSWLKPSSNTKNEESSVTLTSSQLAKQQ